MKKSIIGLLIIAMVLCLAGCGTAKPQEGSSPGTAHIDDCDIEITNCKAQISTYTGQMMAVVWVDFKNNSDTAKCLFFTARIKAFQNGKELSAAAWIPEDHGITDKDTDNIQPGYSLSTGYAFALESTSDPVLIQICNGSTVISEKEYSI